MGHQNLVDAVWVKSTACADGTSCVEVSRSGGRIGVRDSQGGDEGSVLVFSEREWRMFVARVREGVFNTRQ
jgi:hypothetical protein